MNTNDYRLIAKILGQCKPIDNDDAEAMRQIIIEDFTLALGLADPTLDATKFRQQVQLHEPK